MSGNCVSNREFDDVSRWSYLCNLTLIGNAVFVSMDIPDVFFAVSGKNWLCAATWNPQLLAQLSKICNYLNWEKTKVFTFVNFFFIWT